MKTGITILWASATLALAFANLPAAAGQETAVIKTGRVASVPEQKVQLRADEEEELPDSIIVYSPDGEKITKYVYLPGESYGQYTWENGAWKFVSASASTYYLGRYDRENYNVQSSKVSYKITDGELRFYIPYLLSGYSYWYWPENMAFSTNYDANGNLTLFKVLYGNGDIRNEYTVKYNAGNRPLSIEGKHQTGDTFFKVHYEYNDYGYCTLYDSYNWNPEKAYKQTAEYDAQGKLLYVESYENGKMIHRNSYEYYDETHFSSILSTSYRDDGNSGYREEWKYSTDGKPETYYYYENDGLSDYAIIYYPNPSGNIPVSVGGVRVWSSGGQLYIAATANGAAQVYAVSGQLLKTVALTAGQTTATPLPRGVYIVVAGGKTWKVIL